MLWIAIGTASGSTWSLQEEKMTIINAMVYQIKTKWVVHKRLSFEEMKKLTTDVKIKLRGIEERHKHERRIKNIEKEFLLLKEFVFEFPHIYILWKNSWKSSDWKT